MSLIRLLLGCLILWPANYFALVQVIRAARGSESYAEASRAWDWGGNEARSTFLWRWTPLYAGVAFFVNELLVHGVAVFLLKDILTWWVLPPLLVGLALALWGNLLSIRDHVASLPKRVPPGTPEPPRDPRPLVALVWRAWLPGALVGYAVASILALIQLG